MPILALKKERIKNFMVNTSNNNKGVPNRKHLNIKKMRLSAHSHVRKSAKNLLEIVFFGQ